jgi:hypothetical protein
MRSAPSPEQADPPFTITRLVPDPFPSRRTKAVRGVPDGSRSPGDASLILEMPKEFRNVTLSLRSELTGELTTPSCTPAVARLRREERGFWLPAHPILKPGTCSTRGAALSIAPLGLSLLVNTRG